MAIADTLANWKRTLGRDLFALMAAIAGVHLFMLIAIKGVGSAAVASVYRDWMALSLGSVLGGEVWTLVSYALLHDLNGISHVLFNLLALYFFGVPYVRAHSRRQFWVLAVAAAAVGGVLQIALGVLLGENTLMVGASAMCMALLADYAMANPDAKVLLFFALPVQARYLVPIALGIDVLASLSGSDVAVGGHAGGALVGWLAACGWNWRVVRARGQAMLGIRPKKRRFEVINGLGGRPKWPSWRDDPPS